MVHWCCLIIVFYAFSYTTNIYVGNPSILNISNKSSSFPFGRISVKCCKHLCEIIVWMWMNASMRWSLQRVYSAVRDVLLYSTHFLQEDCPGRRCRPSNRTPSPGLDAAWTERTPPPHCCERMRYTRHTAYHLQTQTHTSVWSVILLQILHILIADMQLIPENVGRSTINY